MVRAIKNKSLIFFLYATDVQERHPTDKSFKVVNVFVIQEDDADLGK